MTLFLRMLQDEDKASALDDALAAMRRGESNARVFEVAPEDFAQVPGAPFAYWVSGYVRELYGSLRKFGIPGEREARNGLTTGDDFRWVRTWWEVSSEQLGEKWKCFAKGGRRSVYYADQQWVINWGASGHELKSFSGSIIRVPRYYFRQGLTWPLRASSFMPTPLPKKSIFSVRGYCAFCPDDEIGFVLGLMNTRCFDLLYKINLGRFAYPEFIVGTLLGIPMPELLIAERQLLESSAKACWAIKRSLDSTVEVSHAFWLPALLQSPDVLSLSERVQVWQVRQTTQLNSLNSIQSESDSIAWKVYGISDEDRIAMELGSTMAAANELANEDESEESDDDEGETAGSDASTLVGQLLSWCVGVAFGRWDLRCATGEREAPLEPDPFDALPSRAPGALEAAEPMEWFLDDPGDAARDLVTKVEDVLASLQGTVDWVGEACRILGVRDLRDWFRRRFFDLHLKAYSKSRRKAPIYWPLSVPSGRFAVWLYAPAIHKDSLWRVLQEVAKPRLELESSRYWELKGEVGDAPSRDQVRELDERESLVRELQRFVADLEQAAPLWNPNLDDGTVLCAAVLHRLFQHNGWRKECEAKWRDLEALKYPWAHISLHLWPERVLPLCQCDRSLAIAHDLQEDFWEQDKDENWKPRKLDDAALQALSARFRSATVGTALQSFGAARLESATDTSPKPKATRGRKPKAAKPEQMGLGFD